MPPHIVPAKGESLTVSGRRVRCDYAMLAQHPAWLLIANTCKLPGLFADKDQSIWNASPSGMHSGVLSRAFVAD